MQVKKGSKITKPTDTYYTELSNNYSRLAEFSADPGPPDEPPSTASLFKIKAAKRRHKKIQRKIKKKLASKAGNDDEVIEEYIVMAEDERTIMAKEDKGNARRVTIDAAHAVGTKKQPSVIQRGKNFGRAPSESAHRIVRKIINNNQPHVTFAGQATEATYNKEEAAVLITYDSGADGHYMSDGDRKKMGMPILRVSTKKVGVANGGTSVGKYVTALPFPQLSKKAAEADTFDEFPTSLMSVGKTAKDSNVSVFTKEGVSIYKKEDVKCDERGRYRIPLMQSRGNWQPRRPTKSVWICTYPEIDPGYVQDQNSGKHVAC